MTIHGGKDMSTQQEVNRGLVDSWQGSSDQEDQAQILKRMVRTAVSCMARRERFIVCSHYGIGGKEMSPQEIGQKLHLSPQEVHTIFIVAMSKAQRDADETASWIKQELKKSPAGTHTSTSLH